MAGVATKEYGAGSFSEGGSSPSGEELAEWRCSQQVENGTPSTSPPYWDIDENDDGGPKPSDLYVKFTWRIEKFSQINKRELRSDVFDIGGYKWYILIYPQGCDVCNHLSLFLCVANHDKLLPGWSHFAQFTIAVVNKDPKKSKYSDTLHRFWKKEHDWGWKKFMELSKAMEGFIDADALTIKAQVQVIRERADRPFRCLHGHYRRELIRVYLTNVEDICRRCLEDRRTKLGKIIADKTRWSSFRAFWLSMDQDARHHMCREKAELVLKSVVKVLFLEKEVTSTLIMDSLYSGLKALECQNTGKKSKGKYEDMEQVSVPLVRQEIDTFILVDDVLPLLGRATMDPLPPKDQKGPQDRKKDGTGGDEFSKGSIECDERRLTELGRRTIEIFALDHIFSKIDIAYQEAVSLRRQEELIREEEAAGFAEIDHKTKRAVSEKEKKSKKKQGKQKKNKAKGKDKGRDEKHVSIVEHKIEQDLTPEREDLGPVKPELTLEQSDILDDVSDLSDSVDCVPVTFPLTEGSVDRASEVNSPTGHSSGGINALSGIVNSRETRSPSVVADSSSTCSLDSVPFIVVNMANEGDSGSRGKNHISSSRIKTIQSKPSPDMANQVGEEAIQTSGATVQFSDASQSSIIVESLPRHAAVCSLQDRMINGSGGHVPLEELETGSAHRNLSSNDDMELYGDMVSCASPPRNASKSSCMAITPSKLHFPVKLKSSGSDSPQQTGGSVGILKSAEVAGPTIRGSTVSNAPVAKSKTSMAKFTSRPSSTVAPGPGPTSVVSKAHTAAPVLDRSLSNVDRLDPENTTSSAPASKNYIPPHSYRDATIMGGGHVTDNHPMPNTASSVSPYASQAPETSTPISAAMFLPQQSSDLNPIQPSLSFRIASPQDRGHPWMNRDASTNFVGDQRCLYDNNNYNPLRRRRLESRQQAHVPVADEFPHLDIINDLLDDDYVTGSMAASNSLLHQNFRNGSPHLTRTYQEEHGSPSRIYYDTVPDMTNPQPYMNGADVFAPRHWQMSSGAPVAVGHIMDNNLGYPYYHHHHHHHRVPEYPNLVGVNGYTVFRSSSGL